MVVATVSADRALCTWIAAQLRPLANQPHAIRLTIQAGGGTLTVKREPHVEVAVKTR